MPKIISAVIFIFLFFLNAFTQQTVGLFLNTQDAYDGYTLFAPLNSTTTYLIDNCGEMVHSWPSLYRPGLSCYLMENGILLRPGRIPEVGNPTGIVEMIDWNGNVIWSYSAAPAYGRQHHDIELLPNGNILLIVWDQIPAIEFLQAGGLTNFAFVISEQIIEIQPDINTGGTTVVWEWKAWDHLIQDVNSNANNYGNIAASPERIDINYLSLTNSDWLHFNAIDYNASLDQIIVSVRKFSEFWIIDHSTSTSEAAGSTGGNYNKGGDLLYRWGNPEAYDQGTATNQKLFFQHDAHWIEDSLMDGGKILVFNNQAGNPVGQSYSNVNILELPLDSMGNYSYSGSAYLPNDFDWTYQAPNPTDFSSDFISGAQRLANGNTLICEGMSGRFFEIDLSGNVVWQYVNPVNNDGAIYQDSIPIDNTAFRCTRYAVDYPGLSNQSLIPQGYIESGSNFMCDTYLYTSCEAIHFVNTLIDYDATVTARFYIHANATIETAIDVTYEAANYIELDIGFETEPESNFTARIQDCGL